YQPVPGQRRLAGEGRAYHPHAEVATAIARAFVADVPVAVVHQLQLQRRERRGEPLAHAPQPRRVVRRRTRGRGAHGRTCRNGCTSMAVYTPARWYGSSATQASASSWLGNSATIRLPAKPAGPGSGAS